MIKRLLRRRKERRPKRTSFWKMFAKGMILPILITVAIGNYSWYFIKWAAFTEGYNQMNSFITSYESKVNSSKPIAKLPYALYFSMFGSVDGQILGGYIDPKTWVEPSCKTLSFTFDKDGNIVNSSRAKIGIAIRQSEDPSSSLWYYYDPQDFHIPELDSFISEVIDNRDNVKKGYQYQIDIRELYLNEEERKMIPHVMDVTVYTAKGGLLGYELFEDEWKKEREFTITVDHEAEGYVLIDIASRKNDAESYPRGSIQGVYGCDPQFFDSMSAKYKDRIKEFLDSTSSGAVEGGGNYNTQTIDVFMKKLYTDGEEAGIFAYVETNVHGLHSWRRLYFVLGSLFGLMTLFVFVVCFSRNAKNKAQYAFEDYQRALTNNLAHDLKTPLTVIGGYAENLMEMRRNSADEKELKYLSSIMNNVSYTDDIIAKTLKLSETEQIKKLNKTKVDIKALAEKSAEKYRTALEERSIDIKIEGEGEVTADEDTLMTAVENIISNAVKYTRDGGSIRITADKKRFTSVNDVSEDVDTKDLLMPFVKGDKARSDKSSSGLGLAIASAAAMQNGFKLKVECRDKKFTAAIVF